MTEGERNKWLCKRNRVCGTIAFDTTTNGVVWVSSDGKESARFEQGTLKDVLLSKKEPCTSAKVIVAAGGPAESNCETILLDFASTSERTQFISLLVPSQVKSEGAISSRNDPSSETTIKPEERKPSAPAIQRKVSNLPTEERQLRTLIVDSGIVTQDEFDQLHPSDENSLDPTQQRLGIVHVFDVLGQIVDPQTHQLRPITEQLAADVFRQLPVLGRIYKARVSTVEEATAFWEALIRRTLFFSKTFLDAEIEAASSEQTATPLSGVRDATIDLCPPNELYHGQGLTPSRPFRDESALCSLNISTNQALGEQGALQAQPLASEASSRAAALEHWRLSDLEAERKRESAVVVDACPVTASILLAKKLGCCEMLHNQQSWSSVHPSGSTSLELVEKYLDEVPLTWAPSRHSFPPSPVPETPTEACSSQVRSLLEVMKLFWHHVDGGNFSRALELLASGKKSFDALPTSDPHKAMCKVLQDRATAAFNAKSRKRARQ